MLTSTRISESVAPPFGAQVTNPVTSRRDREDNRTDNRTWTTERVEQLRHYVGAGYTCAEIAREIGVSRNAVIGKLNRLGLSRGRAPAAPRPERDDTRMRRLNVVTQRQILRAVYAETPEPAAAVTVISTHRCSLLELGHGQCRWPLSDPRAEDFSFCGNGVVSGLSYCAGHARMAYRVPARR
jgi:GcrA cell cycle regulator